MKTKAHLLDDGRLAYSVPDAGRLISLSRNTMWALVWAGEIRVQHVGRRILVPRDSLLEFLSRTKSAYGDEKKERSRSDPAA